MEDIFITDIYINQVRHLENVDISLSETIRKHLILTGKNGSGKTSVVDNLYNKLPKKNKEDRENIFDILKKFVKSSINVKFNNTTAANDLYTSPNQDFSILFFPAKRNLKFVNPSGVSKIQFEEKNKKFNTFFIQQLVNVRYELLEAKVDEKVNTEKKLQQWFDNFKKLLGRIYDDENLSLQYNKENYNYSIILSDGRKFNFNQLSDGFSSIIDIVSEILMNGGDKIVNSNFIQGIVLIDEIETHLHIDLQKKILPFLTSFFPKIQFIVTTHSPFVLTSIDNAVIFDLEKQERIEDLSGYSLEGVVRGYFGSDEYSNKLKEQLKEYEELLKKDKLELEERNKLEHLRFHFKELPKFLAPELQVKLQQLELEELTQ